MPTKWFQWDWGFHITEIDKFSHFLASFFFVMLYTAIGWYFGPKISVVCLRFGFAFHAVATANVLTFLKGLVKEYFDWKHPNPAKREGFVSGGDITWNLGGIGTANLFIVGLESHGGIS